jgi:amino acid transporter
MVRPVRDQRSPPAPTALAGQQIRRLLLGHPLPTSGERREHLGRPAGLAVLSGDALGSVAYATEAMVRVLIPVAGVAAFSFVLPISFVIIALLATLVFSYRQTIKAYPTAGGAYVVTRDNFPSPVPQIAATGLLLDYVLTAAVSVSAGVAAIYSAFPAVYPYRVVAAVGLIWLIAWVNLRGIRMTGRVFFTPIYAFIAAILTLIVVGVIRYGTGALQPLQPPQRIAGLTGSVGLYLILHAYASGTTALTGVEAISNGVPIFRPVEWQNARAVLTWMGAILAVLFGGTAFLASRLHPVPTVKETLLSEVARAVFRNGTLGNAGYLLVQITTTGILVFAAETSFSDFPRLSSFAARDGFLPALFIRRGWRLALSTGILVLAFLASLVTVVLGANVQSLIPLFAIGAFSAFTFSQAGMIAHHLRLREAGWRHSLAINGLGAILSGGALAVIVVAKFSQGAWVALVVVPLGSELLTRIHRHYERTERRLALAQASTAPVRELVVLIAVWELDEALERAVQYADSLPRTGDLHAVHPGAIEPAFAAAFRSRYGGNLECIPARRSSDEIRRIVRGLRCGHEHRIVLVVIPEKLEASRRRRSFRRTRGERLRRALSRERGAAVAIVPTMPDDHSLLSGPLRHHVAIVLVDGTDIVAERAMAVGRLASNDHARFVHFDIDAEETSRLEEAWQEHDTGVPLKIEPAPIRELANSLLALVRRNRRHEPALVTVVRGEIKVPWWQRPLHVDEAREAKSALLGEPGTVLVLVPYQL